MIYINEDKLNKIRLTDNNFFVLIDFDKTISTGNSSDSWSILTNPNFTNPKLKEETLKLEKIYFPIEYDYSIDAQTKFSYMEEWYLRTMDLFFHYGLSEDSLKNCIKNSDIKLRDGVQNFFKFLSDLNIPIIILSAGIKNVIVELLNMYHCYYNNIYIVSNNIKFKNGTMLKFTGKILHSSNKSIDRLPVELRNEVEKKDYILLFGDLIQDLNMVPNEYLYKTLSFGFLEKKVNENFHFYKSAFDVVLTDNSSFDDVQAIIDKYIK